MTRQMLFQLLMGQRPPKPKFKVPPVGSKAAEWAMWENYQRAFTNWNQDRGHT